MALRVLLADESSTIKKVFQLALQDFAAEVKSVNVGLDVIDFAMEFQPDIIFADVILQKRNGYDVCADVKAHDVLKTTPVVLMWSHFMELDEDKFEASQADGRLEKPFEVDQLRQLIHDLAPKTRSHKLSKFIEFPDLPDFEDEAARAKAGSESESAVTHEEPQSKKDADWDMDAFEPIDNFKSGDDEFQPVALSGNKAGDNSTPELADEDDDMEWQPSRLSDVRLEEGDSDVNDVEIEISAEDAHQEVSDETVVRMGQPLDDDQRDDLVELEYPEEEASDELQIEEPSYRPQQVASQEPKAESQVLPAPDAAGSLSQERIEAIVREQVEAMVEEVIWKVVPELAKNAIEAELRRLLDENETTPEA